ncbi:hypothetical protein AU193_15785 [Mycobacterium sp. GA-1285]|nr:hypothetical protein AU193_15785 [Mycobacterium sp. GA-1285]
MHHHISNLCHVITVDRADDDLRSELGIYKAGIPYLPDPVLVHALEVDLINGCFQVLMLTTTSVDTLP